MIGISFLSSMLFLGYTTKASTGDITGTGSVSTGSIVTGTTIGYT
jgi:hypothetical protein